MTNKAYYPKMRVGKIIQQSSVDGPGLRTALFVQGCSRECEGCQSPHLWDRDSGKEMDVQTIAVHLTATGLPITISGGEPFDQMVALNNLLSEIRGIAPARHIIVYTGYTWEELTSSGLAMMEEMLSKINVLVDGPYIWEVDNDGLQYMGSSNQRAIHVPASLMGQPGLIPHASPKPVVIDWRPPEIIVTDDGVVLGAAPVVAMMGTLGRPYPARRCGQTS